MALNTSTSVVDYLKSKGEDSSYDSRAKLASQHGISGYTGTMNQNTTLLNSLRNGSSVSTTSQKTSSSPSASGTQSAISRRLQSGSQLSTTNTTNRMTQVAQESDNRLSGMKDTIRDNYDSQLGEQRSIIEQNTANNIKNLEMAYAQAVADGKLSQEEAERQLQENISAIQDQAYLDSEATNVVAESRGIGNSQQMLGMQASTQARTNENLTTARTERDRRINDIQTRLNSIKTQKNLDVANAQNQGNLQQQQAMFGLQSQMNQQLLGVDQQGYQTYMNLANTGLQQQFQTDMANQEQQWNRENMATQQQYNQQNMATQQRYSLESMAKQYGYDINKMSVQQRYNLQNMAQQQQYDMQKIGQQFQNSKSLAQLQYSHDMKMSKTDFERSKSLATYNAGLEQQNVQQQYEQARQWELSKYTPGTAEYQIRESQLNDEMTRIQREIETRAMAEAIAEVNKPKVEEEKEDVAWWQFWK